MTPDDHAAAAAAFKAGRHKLGLSVHQLAAILGVDDRTIRRWEVDPDSGMDCRPPHPAAVTALRWLLAGKLPELPAR